MARLTEREKQIAELVCFGMTEKEMANALFLSQETIKSHKKTLSRKINAHNIADITRWWVEDKYKIKLCPSPLVKKFLAIFLLSLSLYDIFGNEDLLRVFRGKRVRSIASTRVKIRTRTTRSRRDYHFDTPLITA